MMQLYKKGAVEYLTDFWNYIDLIPPIGIYITVIIMLFELKGIILISLDVERSM